MITEDMAMPPECPGCGAKDDEAHIRICRFINDFDWAREQIVAYNKRIKHENAA